MSHRVPTIFLALSILLAACKASGPPTPMAVEDEADFLEALDQAGAEVQPTELIGLPFFGVSGRAYQVNQSLVYVYEFESDSAAEALAGRFSDDGRQIGGTPVPWQETPHIWLAGRLVATYDGDDGGTILLLNGLLGDFLNRPETGTDEPYPPAVAVVMAKIMDIRQLEPGQIEVIGFESITWPDSCLGLPGPDEACTEAEVPGWVVRLLTGEETIVVHTDEFGIEIRWEAGE